GTTVLHNLVALHRSSRALLRWELMEPIPPPATATYETDPRIAAVQASVEPLRGSLLERMHWVNADEPEECVWGFIDGVSMLGQAPSFCMPSWRRFIYEADQTPAFEHYRQVVQLLTWQHPVDPGGFLVLKAPQIALHLDTFADVFPEARFVVTDRDPYRALVSMTVLGQSIVEPFCVVNPVTHPGPDDLDLAISVQTKLAVIHAFTDAHPDRIVHLAYPDLVSEPSVAVTGLLDEIGVQADPELADRIDAFLAAQRAGRRSTPPSSLDTFGYDHDEVLARPVIARYCARFGIDPERQRLTGAS
ncbi:MAG: sulfotransferase, partial [Acidimicrobiales bacterium]